MTNPRYEHLELSGLELRRHLLDAHCASLEHVDGLQDEHRRRHERLAAAALAPGLQELQDQASRLIADFFDDVEPDMADWRERNAALARDAHAAGYKLAVADLEASGAFPEPAPVTAAEVREFLLGLQKAVPASRQKADISAVLELLVTAQDREDGRA